MDTNQGEYDPYEKLSAEVKEHLAGVFDGHEDLRDQFMLEMYHQVYENVVDDIHRFLMPERRNEGKIMKVHK